MRIEKLDENPRQKDRRRQENFIKVDLTENKMYWCDLDSVASRQGPVVGLCEHDNEPLGSVFKNIPTTVLLSFGSLKTRGHSKWSYLERQ